MLDKLYIVPNYECNLNCPHCDLHKLKYKYNSEKFIQQLNTIESREYILFGGEPLLYKDRFIQCIDTKKITSISTNLLLLNENTIEILKTNNIDISSSWNPLRFTEEQYKLWLEKLTLLSKFNLKATILVTLTEDLFQLRKERLHEIFNQIDNTNGIYGILFEYLLSSDANKEFYLECDKWLYEIYKNWQWKFNNFIINRLENWNCDCSNIRTLLPDGSIQLGCPQFDIKLLRYKEDCLQCKLASICNPCRLQRYCTFPKKLYQEYINGSKN